ncbi:MAG TPA: SRPBCC domain-containing protein [Steroidobacteraceae bacterium]|nr:SRPBCC domain-containing protein [Steroidobacteraceae bacterium]
MKATPHSSDSLIFECDFDEPPEKVWRALTEPRLLEAWLGADHSDSAGDPQEPDRPRPALRRARGLDGGDRGPSRTCVDYEVISAEPHRLLRYRWRDRESGDADSRNPEVYSTVTFELAPGPAGGTHLRLTHGEFRIVSAAPGITVARVRPIAGARRRRHPALCFSGQTTLRRAA